MAVEDHIDRLDHSMALNSIDPLRAEIERVYPGSTVIFEDTDPTTEVIAKHVYDLIAQVLTLGFQGTSSSGVEYVIHPASVQLERVKVWETPSSWAEYET